VSQQISDWSGGRIKGEAVVFSSLHKAVGRTKNAEDFARLFR
jgi:hypothetical protein